MMESLPPIHFKRRRSFNEAGHAHELTFSCFHRLPLLQADRTRRWFIQALGEARRRHGFALWAYVLMPEHVHLLLLPASPAHEIAAILKSIKQPVARRACNFLRKMHPDWLSRLAVTWPDGRVEHRFWQQGGGYDRNVTDARTAWSAIQYIHHNPVRRGLVSAAVDWPWSSARCYAGVGGSALDVDEYPADP